jgi:3-deoxy-D-manno-octulosonic-acid transferase
MKSAESFDIRDAVIMANKLAKAGVIAIIEPTAHKVPLIAGE